jgi:hypothetical protein
MIRTSISPVTMDMRVLVVLMAFFFGNTGNAAAAVNGTPPEIGGYKVYYGDLHNHCDISGNGHAVGTPDNAYNYAKNTANLDFFGLADHDIYLTSSSWNSIKTAADYYNQDNVFVAFRGFEWTTTYLGHIAIINSDDYCTSGQSPTNTFAGICAWINARSSCIAFLNHPGRQDGTGKEFDHFAATAIDNMVGMELWNKSDPFTDYYYNDGFFTNDNNKGYFDEANYRGWKVGASGAGDNHYGTWGAANDFRMAILANSLTHADLLEALQVRRFFSTLDKNIALSFTISGSEMGSVLQGAANQTLQVLATDGNGETFTEVVIFNKSHDIVASWTPNASSVNVSMVKNTYDGDYFYVKVTQTDGNEAVSSPVWISGGLTNSAPTCAITSPIGTETYTAPASVSITAEASDADGSISKVAFYANGALLGEVTASPYQFPWNDVASGTYSLTAIAFDDAGASAASSPVSITVNRPAGSYVVDRLVTIGTDDAEENAGTGTMYLTSSDLELVHDALGYDQLIGVRFIGCEIPKDAYIMSAYIQFTCDETSSGATAVSIRGQAADNAATFTSTKKNISNRATTAANVSWIIPAWNTAGTATANERTPDVASIVQEIVNRNGYTPASALAFIITGSGSRIAEAYEGVVASAALLHVEYVTGPQPNVPPTCGITSPANGATFPMPSDVTINAIAGDADGQVTLVEFFSNGSKVGQDATEPYSFTLSDLEIGSYTLTVAATDDSGATTTSTEVVIAVEPPNTPPTCGITSPLNGATYAAPANVTIDASASDGDGSIALVEFYANGAKIGEDATAPYSFVWNSVAAGSYALTAVAIDNDGAQGASDAVPITVNAPAAVEKRITAGIDDVEEYSNGTMVTNSTTLEIVYASKTTGNQVVGLRFTGLNIPAAAVITNAYIQFTSNARKTGTNTVTIRGEDTANASVFTTASKNVSNRIKTAATVSWAIPSWNAAGSAGTAQRTPDLKTIVQEIVNRNDYSAASALAFIITGSGTKIAKSYEDSASAAPLLYVEYSAP